MLSPKIHFKSQGNMCPQIDYACLHRVNALSHLSGWPSKLIKYNFRKVTWLSKVNKMNVWQDLIQLIRWWCKASGCCHSKANGEVRVEERNVSSILDAGHWWVGQGTPVQRPSPLLQPVGNWARASVGRWRELWTSTVQSALTVISKLVLSGLTSVTVIVLSTINLQYQGQFVPNFLRQILRIVADYVMAIVWPSCSSLLPLCRSSSI